MSSNAFVAICFASITLSFCRHSKAENTLDSLVDRHESSVQSILRLDATITVTEVINDGNTVRNDMWKIRWSKEFDRQRQRYRIVQLPTRDENGHLINTGDIYEDRDFRYVLENWDLATSRRLPDPGKQGPVRARKEPRSRKMPAVSFNVASYLAQFEIQAGPEDERRSLRELVIASPRATYEGLVDFEGRSLSQIKVLHPHTRNGKYYKGCEFTILLDREFGYLIRRLLLHVPKDDALNRPHGRYEYTALEFKQLENNCFFPTEAEYSIRFPDFSSAVSSKYLLRANQLTINQELPNDALDFVFPENAIVNFERIDGSTRRTFLWGPDNKPVKEIFSVADVPRPQPQKKSKGNRILVTLSFAFLGILVITGLVAYRKYSK